METGQCVLCRRVPAARSARELPARLGGPPDAQQVHSQTVKCVGIARIESHCDAKAPFRLALTATLPGQEVAQTDVGRGAPRSTSHPLPICRLGLHEPA